MKAKLLDACIDAEEAALYNFVNKCKVIESTVVPTIGINRNGCLYINPDFLLKNEQHIIGLLLHEAMHIYFDHVNRYHKNHTLANIAQDIVINNLITYSLPSTAVTYESLNVPRTLRTSDEIYEWLLENAPENLQDDHTLTPDDDNGDSEQQERLDAAQEVVNEIVNSQREYERQKYSLPEKSKITKYLETVLGRFLKVEYTRSFARQPRVRISGVILPASRGYVYKPSLSIYLDVSGSMEGERASESLGILEDVSQFLTAYRRKNYIFNTETNVISSFDKLAFGGGTCFESFHPSDDSDMVIIITDCEFEFDFLKNHKRKKVIVIDVRDNTIDDVMSKQL